MTGGWGFAGVATMVAAVVVRDLIGLRRHCMRHESLNRLTSKASPGTRIIDREPDGAIVEITVGCRTDETDQASSSVDRPAV